VNLGADLQHREVGLQVIEQGIEQGIDSSWLAVDSGVQGRLGVAFRIIERLELVFETGWSVENSWTSNAVVEPNVIWRPR